MSTILRQKQKWCHSLSLGLRMFRFKHTTWCANHIITTLDNTTDVKHCHEGIVSAAAATATAALQLVHGSCGGGLIWNWSKSKHLSCQSNSITKPTWAWHISFTQGKTSSTKMIQTKRLSSVLVLKLKLWEEDWYSKMGSNTFWKTPLPLEWISFLHLGSLKYFVFICEQETGDF